MGCLQRKKKTIFQLREYDIQSKIYFKFFKVISKYSFEKYELIGNGDYGPVMK